MFFEKKKKKGNEKNTQCLALIITIYLGIEKIG